MKKRLLSEIMQSRKGKRSLFTFAILLLVSVSLMAQQVVTVKGQVTSIEDGATLPGVNIIIKGTTNGVVTDIDGSYSIQAKTGDVLHFSFIGMTDKEITVTGNKLDVVLEMDAAQLEEVVVIGYGTAKKKEINGAVAQVKSEILERTVASDLGTALQGQIAGVSVTSSTGAPGENAVIQIRGIASVFGSNEPLWVVDGIPMNGNPRLSPNEIETIDVLKDAASAAIYGTRGAAGVILVTTKQGSGSVKVRVNSSVGVKNITSETPVMNTLQHSYFSLIEQRNATGLTDDQITSPFVRYPAGILNDTDLTDIVYVDNAITQDHNINISGGSKDISYNVVTGYYKQEGVIVRSDFERFNTRASTSYKRGKWDIRGVIGLTAETTDRATSGIFTQTTRYLPTQQALTLDHNTPVESPGWGAGAQRTNWVLNSLNNTNILKRERLNAGYNASVEIADGLTLRTNIGATITHMNTSRFNRFTPHYSPDGDLLSSPSDGFAQEESIRQSGFNIDGGATYSKKFNLHKLTAMAAYSFEKYGSRAFLARKNELSSNDIEVLNSATANPLVQSVDHNTYTYVTVGLIGRLMYDYDGKYSFSAILRRDGSSRFPEQNRYAILPSVQAGWIISQEKFWNPLINSVNYLKFRVSEGTTGNQGIPNYSFTSAITQNIDYTFGHNSNEIPFVGAAESGFANGDVKWEVSRMTNVGIDLGLMNDKLTLNFDYYNTRKTDMLFNRQLAPSQGGLSGGGSRVVMNIGDMTNKGFEMALNYRTRIKEFDVGINGTFATNENKITEMQREGIELAGDSYLILADGLSTTTGFAKGYEAGAFFLRPTDGIIRSDIPDGDTYGLNPDSGEELSELSAYQLLVPTAKIGDTRYIDSNGDSLIDDNDRIYLGSGLPKYEIGANITLKYKGFDFLMQWYAAVGHEVMNGSRADAISNGRHRDLLYSWSEANPDAPFPAYRGGSKKGPNYLGQSDLWLEDGSYVRLKTLTLGYSLPTTLLDKYSLSKMRVYLSAQNPITITNYKGFDPEVGGNGLTTRGVDRGNYPVTSFYLMGVNLTF